MKKKYIFALIVSSMVYSHAWAAVVTDGEFSMWNFNNIGNASISQEVTGGNPDERLNITTVTGITAYGLGIKSDYSTNMQLAGTTFEFQLDVLSGPGAHGEGQRIHLLVEQDSNIYGYDLGITGYPLSWDIFSFQGTFNENNFVLMSGAGPVNPDFSGGVDTFFGFSGSNTNSGTLTQYYDNYSLGITPVPIAPAIWLFGSGIVGIIGFASRKTIYPSRL